MLMEKNNLHLPGYDYIHNGLSVIVSSTLQFKIHEPSTASRLAVFNDSTYPQR